jgi:hypothetical protein
MKKILVALVLALGLVTVAAGCGDTKKPETPKKDGK